MSKICCEKETTVTISNAMPTIIGDTVRIGKQYFTIIEVASPTCLTLQKFSYWQYVVLYFFKFVGFLKSLYRNIQKRRNYEKEKLS